jgi:cholinesterase
VLHLYDTSLFLTSLSPISDCVANLAVLAGPFTLTTAQTSILTSLSQQDSTLNEDCLTLNVWTKPQAGEKQKAVLVWIFGGG